MQKFLENAEDPGSRSIHMHKNMDKHEHKFSHVHTLTSMRLHICNLMQTDTHAPDKHSLSLFQCHCLSLCCGPLLHPSLSSGGDACLAAGTFPFLRCSVPRCICRGSSLSLQKAQRKKIRKLALMKTRSTVTLSPLLSLLLLSLPLLP